MSGGYVFIMKTKNIVLTATAIFPFLAGCASTPIVLAPVGPNPSGETAFAGNGSLEVFSDTETHEIAENTYYYPHTGYSLRDASGRLVEYVPNHIGSTDESPTLVTIPAGDYKVIAESSSYGRVTVPVAILPDRTTIVHLDRVGSRPQICPQVNWFISRTERPLAGAV
jgi:hypothetical protein